MAQWKGVGRAAKKQVCFIKAHRIENAFQFPAAALHADRQAASGNDAPRVNVARRITPAIGLQPQTAVLAAQEGALAGKPRFQNASFRSGGSREHG